jgi:hypothetical protein
MSYTAGYMLFPNGSPIRAASEAAARSVALEAEKQRLLEQEEEAKRLEAEADEVLHAKKRYQERQIHQARLRLEQNEARKGMKVWIQRGGHIDDKVLEKELRAEVEQEEFYVKMQVLYEGYHHKYRAFMLANDPVTFRDMPWPTMKPPATLSALKAEDVLTFLKNCMVLDEGRPAATWRETLRQNVKWWHEDKFQRIFDISVPEEREAVKEGQKLVYETVKKEWDKNQKLWQGTESE